MTTSRSRTWRPAWPCPVGQISGQLRHGAGDPTYRSLDGSIWRGLRTPAGVVTLRIEPRPALAEVLCEAWGPGAAWVLDQVPAMLGAEDDPGGFDPRHEVLVRAYRRFRHWRVPRTGLVMDSLVPAIIEQKVTGREAFAGWRNLVRRFGEPAPGPGAEHQLWVAPSPAQLLAIPSWDWLHLGVDPARSRTVVRAAQVAPALERTVGVPVDEVDRRLQSVPGIGRWTSAEVRARAHGDADAVSFGDFHVAKDVGWALTGAPVDDDGLAELLEPYRPHRLRAQRLVELSGQRPPRRGPRMAPRAHLPTWSG
ncbi:DNA-3-methyladenine glycosylase [Georgenia sp. SYP-B2076]|uniref:DNA-3-methyladenine glycosylase family protein n=1 Tax=Georgenia sp. SYP-B2076 TaxID=2495881 RepID=UPI000F8CBFE4|nr:DNA-3-methyladenine glycosylase 2 family protein [Georgenia sp. SYP-B2076]